MIIIDTETTGLKPGIDELLQVSIIDTHGAVLLDEYIKPDRATEWAEAMRINGITPEMVANARSIRDPYLHAKIQHIINSADKIIGYNVMFDIAFLAGAGFDVPNQDELVDVMIEFAEIYGDWREDTQSYKWQKLTTAAAYYGFDWPINAHNSLGDCLATLHVYNSMQQQSKLRPCPFCGSDRVHMVDNRTLIRCEGCMAEIGIMGLGHPDDIIKAYNRRSSDKPHGETLHIDDMDKILDDALGDDQYQRCDRCGTYRPKNEMFDGLCEECRAEDAAAARAEDAEDQIQRCTRCGTYVDKDTMYAGICAECQAEDEAKSKQAGWYKIEEIIKEVLPDE